LQVIGEEQQISLPANCLREPARIYLMSLYHEASGEPIGVNPTGPERHNSPEDRAARRDENLDRVSGASREERWFHSLVQYSSDIVAVLEADGTLRYISPSVERVLGYRPEDLVGKSAFDYIHPESNELVASSFAKTLEISGVRPPLEFLVRAGDDSWHDMEVICNNRFSDSEVQGMIVNARDITGRKRAEEQLRYQALHDLLTDLPNRRLFVDRLQHALRRTRRRPERRVAVLFMDLYNFKLVNDSVGHDTGDKLLVGVAERLRSLLRPEDMLARFGGDEFTVLIEDIEDPADAMRVAERIVEGFREHFVLNGQEFFAAASIGIAYGSASTTSPEKLLRNADAAMYRAKERGPLGYEVFDQSMYLQAVRRLKLENDIRRAFLAGEFVVHYQPIVDLRSDEVQGVEALVRWNHPERGLLNPEEFVPVAEEIGLIVPMGEAVMEEACRLAVRWQEEHPRLSPLLMNVNLSAKQLQRPDLITTVEGVLQRTGLDPSLLTLDITETVYVRVLEGNTAALNDLRRLGVKISIDDFGVGYSSLAYLKRLPADILKLDKTFVEGLGEDLEDTAIVRMVIDLARTLGIEVIAEGVHSEAATILKEMGCNLAQGFFFAEPLPPEEVPRLLVA
jgi:diguanylate cyclase (GGDEF)-like protein/PAS domain S-box-containing protein